MFTVYRITNLINDKTYIGVHKTDNPNDEYFGSGRAILAAIRKHGKHSFRKEVLFIFGTSSEAYAKEVDLTADFHVAHTYNMRRGGVGGFTVENARKGAMAAKGQSRGGAANRDRGIGLFALSKDQLREAARRGGLAHKGRIKSPEHRERLRQAAILQWKRQKEAKSKSGDRLLITV